jgi:hypothetical protein
MLSIFFQHFADISFVGTPVPDSACNGGIEKEQALPRSEIDRGTTMAERDIS